MRTSLVFLFFFVVATAIAQTGNNTIEGKIELPAFNDAFFKKGTSYKGDDSPSKEKLRIDALNAPANNIYISMHPLDFDPKLPPSEEVKMTQRAKTFFPNIVAVTKGSTVYFVNEDEHYHNVYSLSSKARFNIGRRQMGNVYGQKINKVGIIKLGCDIHPEMGAVILSLDTPYFTKIKENGSYKISNLPDGAYELKVYHPAIEKYSTEVEIKGGQVLTQNIKLQTKA